MRIEAASGVNDVRSGVARFLVHLGVLDAWETVDVVALDDDLQPLAGLERRRRRQNLDIDRHDFVGLQRQFTLMRVHRLVRRRAGRIEFPVARAQPAQGDRANVVFGHEGEGNAFAVAVDLFDGDEQIGVV